MGTPAAAHESDAAYRLLQHDTTRGRTTRGTVPSFRGPARPGGAEALPCRCCEARPDERAEAKDPRGPLSRGPRSAAARPHSPALSRESLRVERLERGTRVTRVPLLVTSRTPMERVSAPSSERRRESLEGSGHVRHGPRSPFPHPPREGRRFPDGPGCLPPYDRRRHARFRAISPHRFRGFHTHNGVGRGPLHVAPTKSQALLRRGGAFFTHPVRAQP